MLSYATASVKGKKSSNNSCQEITRRPIIQKMDLREVYDLPKYNKKDLEKARTNKNELDNYESKNKRKYIMEEIDLVKLATSVKSNNNILEKKGINRDKKLFKSPVVRGNYVMKNSIFESQLIKGLPVDNEHNVICINQSKAKAGGYLGHAESFVEFNNGKKAMNYMIELRTERNISGTASWGSSSLSVNSGSTSKKSAIHSSSSGTGKPGIFGNVVIYVKPLLNLDAERLKNPACITVNSQKASDFIRAAQEKQGKSIMYSLIHGTTNEKRMNCASFMQMIINESQILPNPIPNPRTIITPYNVVEGVKNQQIEE